ncbi:hypothetical protein [Polaribacter sp.]|uniref:hypothetical protein n=1 Tax=Polaribacter sp. TaxID=1920175 RepID=UPI003F69D047
MKQFKIYTLLFLSLAIFSSCEEEVVAPDTAYASFEAYFSSDVTVTPGEVYNKSVSVYTANISDTDRTINLTASGSIDAASYTMPTSVTIPANTNEAVVNLTFNENGLEIISDKTLTIAMEGSEAMSVGEPITLNVAKGCPAGEGKVKVAVTLDSYPEEVYWRIVNLDLGAIVMANNATPAYGGYAGLSGVQRDANCLVNGNYRVDIFDSYQDGAGAFEITVNGVQVFASNGAYGAGVSSTFVIN